MAASHQLFLLSLVRTCVACGACVPCVACWHQWAIVGHDGHAEPMLPPPASDHIGILGALAMSRGLGATLLLNNLKIIRVGKQGINGIRWYIYTVYGIF